MTPTDHPSTTFDPPFTLTQTALAPHQRATLAAKVSVAKRKADREASLVVLEDGSKVYPDSPPGIGWVLEKPGYNKKYMSTKDLCLELHSRLPVIEKRKAPKKG